MLILAYSGFRFVYGTKATAAASTCICECVRAPICLCVRVYVCTEWAVWSAGSAMRQRACVQLVTMINLALIVAAAKSNKNKHYTMFKWVSCWRGLEREWENWMLLTTRKCTCSLATLIGHWAALACPLWPLAVCTCVRAVTLTRSWWNKSLLLFIYSILW